VSTQLILYVNPGSAVSLKARRNLDAVLATYDAGAISLEVRDVTKESLRAEEDRVVFTPTLILKGAGPAGAWVVGDLGDHDLIVTLLRLGGVERPL
jgi:hypothetical protein